MDDLVRQERAQQSTAWGVLPVRGELVPQEPVQLCTAAVVDVPAPQVLGRSVSEGMLPQRSDQVVDVHVPQASALEMTVEQVVDVPRPRVDPIIEVPQVPSNEHPSMQEQVIVQKTPTGDGRHASSSPPNWRRELMNDVRVCCWQVHTRQTEWKPPEDEGISLLLAESEEEEEQEEGTEEMDLDELPSRFQGHFRPRRFCLLLLGGDCRRTTSSTLTCGDELTDLQLERIMVYYNEARTRLAA